MWQILNINNSPSEIHETENRKWNQYCFVAFLLHIKIHQEMQNAKEKMKIVPQNHSEDRPVWRKCIKRECHGLCAVLIPLYNSFKSLSFWREYHKLQYWTDKDKQPLLISLCFLYPSLQERKWYSIIPSYNLPRFQNIVLCKWLTIHLISLTIINSFEFSISSFLDYALLCRHKEIITCVVLSFSPLTFFLNSLYFVTFLL